MLTPPLASDLPAAFELADSLFALCPNAIAVPIPLRSRASTDADWVVGVKPVTDQASIHGDYWERHPRGDEILCLLEGHVAVVFSSAGVPERRIDLDAGQALIVPRGHWPRLQVQEPGRLMFITPSIGSEHRRVAAASGGAFA